MPQRPPRRDLRSTLLVEATAMIREAGIEGLTLRRLAERAEVTPPALYHHFRDKNDLLCAIAENGFADLEASIAAFDSGPSEGLEGRTRAFVQSYIGFASSSPETYDLMFGRTIWKVGRPTESLRTIAYRTFRSYVAQIRHVMERANLTDTEALRVAQASWAMLHGLCRLRIDGIYVDEGDLASMADEATRFLLGRIASALEGDGAAGTPRARRKR